MNKDKIEFVTMARLNEEGNLEWHTEITWQSKVLTEEFKEALWDQFTVEVEEKTKE